MALILQTKLAEVEPPSYLIEVLSRFTPKKEMNERRKIIIPTGTDPDEPLTTPHFDAEATLTARPVIPLSEQETFRMHYGDYAGQALQPFWKRPALLALIVLVAVGVGVAAGLAIGIYRNRKTAEVPVTAAQPAPVESASTGQVVEQAPTPPVRQSVPENSEKPAETPVEPKAEAAERTTRNEQKKEDEVAPPVVPVKKRDEPEKKGDDEAVNEKQAEKERRREERRERRRRQRDDEEAIDLPRGIERAQKEVNRIREIFEGRQP